ncbi:ergothioneine biosynthesis glutamate--cysteine ligase EgtA [Solwaraspora sp. WMMD1047]|uniref:ergothioneine biosynthesis glutamate--cysteine ligase EgtA n=1 Tax=Solwaraspora sp. WMMD1047 TaxID=3016102 RepID=UPI002417E548|nr:ergothioneine biosynthesis glutamate--cysteine ligase EgtA [Solwaraspora sp. WMMD1047]MDG4830959.1 ergothioneine biosynthesis glutamate--cysteine ligase EgtA [Solwaraspora sp. WMMD1047]
MSTHPDLDGTTVLREESQAEGYLARICFKTGPPALTGVELEWTVHDAAEPDRHLDRTRLRTALGRYAPSSLDPHRRPVPLPHSGTVTVEPGGQVEISTAPRRSLDDLHQSARSDIAHLSELLNAAGLTLGDTGIDPHRPPRPLLDTARYRAMRRAFDRRGPAGRTMMYSTAGLQLCLDAGESDRLAQRWYAVHALGPPLVAAFATARRHAGRDTGWASARMAAWLAIDPARTGPVWTPAVGPADPVHSWIRYALTAPLLCVRRRGGDWLNPYRVSFRDWIGGALPRPPTRDDLDYHLTTLFPPVRPRGYLEIRYLDGQPGDEWVAPVAVLAALLADEAALGQALAACEPVLDRWRDAALLGLADPDLARAAARVLDLATRVLDRTDLRPATREQIGNIVDRRLAAGERRPL